MIGAIPKKKWKAIIESGSAPEREFSVLVVFQEPRRIAKALADCELQRRDSKCED